MPIEKVPAPEIVSLVVVAPVPLTPIVTPPPMFSSCPLPMTIVLAVA